MNVELWMEKLEDKKEGIVKVAKSMVDENIDINIISKVTGLSIKEVSKLKIN